MNNKANIQQAALNRMVQVMHHAEICHVSDLITPMKLISKQTGLRLNRTREFRICKAIMIRSILYN